MEYKTLGNTGLLVSNLCFGTMTFHGGDGFWKAIGAVDQKGADELVKASVDAGINFFDTADVYSEGESEKTLGRSLRNLNIARKDVVIATKVFGRVGLGRNDVGASRGHIMDAVDASLARLQMDHIDLYQIHGNDSVTPVEETLRALETLVSQGKVRYIGCSNWQGWKIAKALGISEFKNLARFDTLQAYYSIAGRDLERDIVPMLVAEKVGLLVWSPLAGGLLSGKFSRENQKPEDSRRSQFDFPVVDKERTWKICLLYTSLKVCIGTVSHRTLQADRAEDVAAEIRKAMKYIPAERLIVSSDCGFGRGGCNREISFYKASAIAQGANIVRRELGFPASYVPAADPMLQIDVVPGRG